MPSNLMAKRSIFKIKCELSGIQARAKMEGTAGIRAFSTAFLWPQSAKMARNGAAESGRCSSGQRGAAEGGIGRAPAGGLGELCGWRAPCQGQPIAGHRSKSRRTRALQRAKNAAPSGWARLPAAPSGWKHFLATSQQGGGSFETATRCPSPRGRRLPLAPLPAARAMGGESAHPCFGR